MKTCLVVEDEPLLLDEYVQTVKELGLLVRTAKTYDEVAYHLKAEAFSLVLMDLDVPGGNTLSLLETFHGLYAPTSVIVITGTHVFPNGELFQIAPSVDFVLRKPVTPHDLSAIVEQVIAR